MITLLAESKTMSPVQEEISLNEFESHKPILEETADSVMAFISDLSIQEISGILGVSPRLAQKINEQAYDFPNKTMGYKAIKGFTGEAYRALDILTLSKDSMDFAEPNLRIISSLYGLLRPDDIIKPYRLDFNKNCGPGQTNLTKILKPKVTVAFVNFIKSNCINEVLDLLPAEAAKCLDWKIIKAFVKVNKINFQVITPSGVLKTPGTARLKELRGLMTRDILQNRISSFSELFDFRNNEYVYSPGDSKSGLPVFISAE
ncbi:MAG: YaaA family protein [Muribaculaceae bacterium]|nr:YaaA family protein [Muribaculaceae bacterium]